MDVTTKTKKEVEFLNNVCEKMIEQFQNKNIAYGDSFGQQFKKYGKISALVRMSDKFSRLESIVLGAENKVGDERLEDTLVDLSCYCLMTLYELGKEEERLVINSFNKTGGYKTGGYKTGDQND